jgi:hypothetical protein
MPLVALVLLRQEGGGCGAFGFGYDPDSLAVLKRVGRQNAEALLY